MADTSEVSDRESEPILEDQENGLFKPYNKELTLPLVIASSAAVVGSSFQFGYNTGVINAPGSVIQDYINHTYFERHGEYMQSIKLNLLWGFIVSIFAIGGMFGSISSGYFAGRYGRKLTMLGNNAIALLGATLMGCSGLGGSYELLIIGRFVIGFNCGINTALAPLYLTEIAPLALRGMLGAANQLGIVTSLLISEVLGLSYILGTPDGWPVLLALTGIFALYQLVVLPFCPETPPYLLSEKKDDEAKISLQFLRKQEMVSEELGELSSQRDEALSSQRLSVLKLFCTSHLRQPLVVAVVMQLSQQLSGINAAFYYSTGIFESAGVPASKSDLITVGMGLANVVMTLASLLLIERLGRRFLHLAGLGGMFFCSVLLVVALTTGKSNSWGAILSVVAVILFVMSFQTGPGSIPWFITAELFAPDARGAAMSVAGLVNWTGNFIVGIGYPPLNKILQGYTFIVFAVLLAFFWLFTYFYVPETKGRSVEEIRTSFAT